MYGTEQFYDFPSSRDIIKIDIRDIVKKGMVMF